MEEKLRSLLVGRTDEYVFNVFGVREQEELKALLEEIDTKEALAKMIEKLEAAIDDYNETASPEDLAWEHHGIDENGEPNIEVQQLLNLQGKPKAGNKRQDCKPLNYCSDAGICNNGVCECDDGFSGDDCSYKECPNDCNGHGLCSNGRCLCMNGFTGAECEIDVILEDVEDYADMALDPMFK